VSACIGRLTLCTGQSLHMSMRVVCVSACIGQLARCSARVPESLRRSTSERGVRESRLVPAQVDERGIVQYSYACTSVKICVSYVYPLCKVRISCVFLVYPLSILI
jgi:hypothetical protein